MTFIALVCGGREFWDRKKIYQVLDELHARNKFTHVLHGDAPGADSVAGEWAFDRQIPQLRCAPYWAHQGRAAGFIRNRAMADLCPDLVVAFPGGPGTRNMVTLAKQRNLKVEEVKI